ncbi:MAG: TetR/AcrR family transcriptional regulator [bacterium]|nr:TetR/AcrR family transcriptional regulator [bacterium]
MGRPSTRDKLLDCAEALFGDHGLEGVSLRTINTRAGLSPAALHYHFGSKDALLEALLERRMPALMERRRRLLDELSAATKPPTTRGVLAALVLPLVELVAEGREDGLRYLRLIHRLQADRNLDPQFVIERWPGGVERLVPLLRKANPSMPLSVIEFRLSLVIELMLQSLAHGAPPAGADFDAHVSALLDFLTGGFDAAHAGD